MQKESCDSSKLLPSDNVVVVVVVVFLIMFITSKNEIR